ncbi:Alpha/Beta hydrolase protein [Diplogelasinospora grovesii]|uniref:Alpha/Beta hydrolase protein n=1 Tax=Diplogelasinospora grovesii TaxID=303347 RepID=A0AAN6S2Y5_9PEZI|nr:Alpha/Beta hydrolase protein [Diplogelasinospora grovesii]
MLPEPTLTFTLPSLHDGLPLDCRVYHPLSLTASPNAPAWKKHAAIIAHPYAPLGGCYDDPVVDIVASTLLRLGLLVGTFNFRGANGSAGRTSWTAKAERADFTSFVGFITHYVYFLDPFRLLPSSVTLGGHDLATQIDGAQDEIAVALDAGLDGSSESAPRHMPVLLMGGYSYGAMVTTQLPSLKTILAPFNTPAHDSYAAEIRLRAEHLAEMQNEALSGARAAAVERQSGKPMLRKALGLRVGGDEENRKSHDHPRHSFHLDPEDRIRKGVAELMVKARRVSHRKENSHDTIHDASRAVPEDKDAPHDPTHDCLLPLTNDMTHRAAYLLVSPLQGVITNLATMSFPMPFRKAARRSVSGPIPPGLSKASTRPDEPAPGSPSEPALVEAEDKLVLNPTLAIYGDRDGFVAARKLREWASRLESVSGSRFRAHEVSSAGHFWQEERVAYIMRDAVKTFVESVLRDGT